MSLIKILRFENAEHVGMYTAADDIDFLQDWNHHPSPKSDVKLWLGLCEVFGENYPEFEEYRFGFISKAQARRWVYRSRWLHSLDSQGIILSEYFCEPDDVIIGNTQVIFKDYKNRICYNILDYFGIKG